MEDKAMIDNSSDDDDLQQQQQQQQHDDDNNDDKVKEQVNDDDDDKDNEEEEDDDGVYDEDGNRIKPSLILSRNNKSIHGMNARNLIEKITRIKIQSHPYWKEKCIGLNEETLVDRAMVLSSYGGTYGGNKQPTQFLCLMLKMLQIKPDRDIVIEFITNQDFKYVTVLGAFYLRLVGKPLDIYTYLEPLYNDCRAIRLKTDTGYTKLYIDEFAQQLLTSNYACDIALPHLPPRATLEKQGLLSKRISALEELGLVDIKELREKILNDLSLKYNQQKQQQQQQQPPQKNNQPNNQDTIKKENNQHNGDRHSNNGKEFDKTYNRGNGYNDNKNIDKRDSYHSRENHHRDYDKKDMGRDSREYRDNHRGNSRDGYRQDSRDYRDYRDDRGHRDYRDNRDNSRDSRDYRDGRESRDYRNHRDGDYKSYHGRGDNPRDRYQEDENKYHKKRDREDQQLDRGEKLFEDSINDKTKKKRDISKYEKNSGSSNNNQNTIAPSKEINSEQQEIDEMNAIRAKLGLKPLKP